MVALSRRFLVACGLLAVLGGLAYAATRGGSEPGQEPVFDAPRGERCLADAATMRREHMRHLHHQRDLAVREGQREPGRGFQDCIECHAGEKTGTVLGETGFCASCHRYAAVQIDCFECHSPRLATASERQGKTP